MQKARTGRHFGVFGHYGHRNLGDESITEAVIQNLRSRWPDVEVTGFSMDPQDTARRYRIRAFPIRQLDRVPRTGAIATSGDPTREDPIPATDRSRFGLLRDYLKRIALLRALVHSARFALGLPLVLGREFAFLRSSYRIARGIDCFFIAGSNQFLDNFGGVWGFPYTLLKWTVLARCAGARVVFVSVGAGPIDSLWSRIMVRAALLLSEYVSFRDPGSRRLIEWFGSGGRWHVYPDLAQSLLFERLTARAESSRPVVGINPMPVYDRRYWYTRDDVRYESYVGQLSRFASRLMRERYRIFFFSTQPTDEGVIDDVMARLPGDLVAAGGPPDRMKPSNTVAELMNVFGSADIVVATRYHGTVLGLHARRPVLAICYYRKTREVLQSMGQEDYAVDVDDLDDADLWRRFEMLVANRHEEIRKIERGGEKVHALLAEQYDSLLKILEPRAARKEVPED